MDSNFERYEQIFSSDNLLQMAPEHFNYFIGGFIKNCMEYIENTDDNMNIYYSFMNISGLNIPNPIKYKVMLEAMKSPKLRQIIWDKSITEIADSLGETLGLTNPELLEDLRDDLLGPDFLMLGYQAKRDWPGFIERIEPYVEQKINSVEDPEKIIFWSSRDTTELNAEYTTVENATIGNKMLFLEGLVFINWASESSQIPTFSPFWEELSAMYTKTVLTRLEQEEKTSIPFYSTSDEKDGVKFGPIFQKIELPMILESGIDTININVKDGSEYALDIYGLRQQYQSMKKDLEPGVLIPMINQELRTVTQTLIGGEKQHG
ncbi:MAG: hypothetical protein IJN90_01635 [Bacilli bacterium]|nr:hypothetical protein [Bacilli bacterium]